MWDRKKVLESSEEVEYFKKKFDELPVVVVPQEDEKVAKVLNEIAKELKKIRATIERRS